MPLTVTSKIWNAELKKQKVDKDAGLGDALDDYAKAASKKNLEKEADALDEACKKALAAGKLLKAHKELAKIADTVVIQGKAELRRLREAIKSGEDEEEEAEGEDKELYLGLKRAKTQPMFFALVVKSATEGKLIVSKMKVKPSDISDAKKDLGAGKVLRGTCRFANGRHQFVTKQDPPATLAKLIKLLAKKQAGLMIKPECRGGGEDDEMEAEQ